MNRKRLWHENTPPLVLGDNVSCKYYWQKFKMNRILINSLHNIQLIVLGAF